MAVSFIGGGNRRKPQTCHKSLTIVYKGGYSSWPLLWMTIKIKLSMYDAGLIQNRHHNHQTESTLLQAGEIVPSE